MVKILIIIWGTINAQGKFSGYMFGDYYYVAQTHYPDSLNYEGQNGFSFRRIYFTYDNEISENLIARLRMEYESKDFREKTSPLIPFVKDAYLKWKIKTHNLILGISPTPTLEKIEEIWGYRSVEKTPLDLQKVGSSRDFGIAMEGSIDEKEILKYHIMFGNGEGYKSENNKYKKFMASFGFNLKPFYLELYGDFKEGEKNVYVLQGFSSFKNERFRTGIQYAIEIKEEKPDTYVSFNIFSLFFVYNINEKISFLLRYDKTFEANPRGEDISYIPISPLSPSNLIISGVDLKLHKNVSLIPNVEYVFYDKVKVNGKEKRPESDLYLRLTFFYKFK